LHSNGEATFAREENKEITINGFEQNKEDIKQYTKM